MVASSRRTSCLGSIVRQRSVRVGSSAGAESLVADSIALLAAVLGLPYDESLDIWAVGCTLFELYTGKILFPGRSNNQMLHLMMELKGKFAHRMIKKSRFGEMHFDEGMNFRSVERDKITGQVGRACGTLQPPRGPDCCPRRCRPHHRTSPRQSSSRARRGTSRRACSRRRRCSSG